MSREEVRKMLGENATEEQITNVLNGIHQKDDEVRKLQDQIKASESTKAELESIRKQMDDINKAKMTEAEKLELQKQETEKNLKNSREILSRAKAQEILSLAGITDEEIINTVVNEDMNATIARATSLANKFKLVQEETVKKTRESLTNIDLTPNPSNNPQGTMTWDKFNTLSQEEQNKFAEEHPQEFNKL